MSAVFAAVCLLSAVHSQHYAILHYINVLNNNNNNNNNQATQQKMDKYSKLLSTHIFCPVAVETAGTWNGWPSNLFRRLADAPQSSLKMSGKRCFCSSACQWPSKTQCPPNELPLQPLTLFFNIYTHMKNNTNNNATFETGNQINSHVDWIFKQLSSYGECFVFCSWRRLRH